MFANNYLVCIAMHIGSTLSSSSMSSSITGALAAPLVSITSLVSKVALVRVLL